MTRTFQRLLAEWSGFLLNALRGKYALLFIVTLESVACLLRLLTPGQLTASVSQQEAVQKEAKTHVPAMLK